jgi:hypothetical protein
MIFCIFFSLDKKRNGPAMGLNGFIIDRKQQIYQSQPALVYSSTPPPPPNGYMNGHSPKEEQYSVVLRPKKVRFWFFKHFSRIFEKALYILKEHT